MRNLKTLTAAVGVVDASLAGTFDPKNIHDAMKNSLEMYAMYYVQLLLRLYLPKC